MFDPEDNGLLTRDMARRLLQTRQALGFGQLEFSEGAGLSQPQYSQFETGKRLLTLKAALRLCQKYNITMDWLYMGDIGGLPYRLADQIKQSRTSNN